MAHSAAAAPNIADQTRQILLGQAIRVPVLLRQCVNLDAVIPGPVTSGGVLLTPFHDSMAPPGSLSMGVYLLLISLSLQFGGILWLVSLQQCAAQASRCCCCEPVWSEFLQV